MSKVTLRKLDSLRSKTEFEIFVQKGFCDLELSSVISTLQLANRVQRRWRFSWRISSDTPGLVCSSGSSMVRAEPEILEHYPSDYLIVIGSKSAEPSRWLRRARGMRRLGRKVVFLSDASALFASEARCTTGAITAHWFDTAILNEQRENAALSDKLSEYSNGFVTAGGRCATPELILGILEPKLLSVEIIEIGRHLLLDKVRRSSDKQPSKPSAYPRFLDETVSKALELMEANISEPLSMPEIADHLKCSQRMLERRIRSSLKDSPARFYKRIRIARARHLISETNLSLIEIAMSTGFGTTGNLSKVHKEYYGHTPTEFRNGQESKILEFTKKD